MLAQSTDSQTNNYRSSWCWEESKPSIEKQMFIICSNLFSFLSFFFLNSQSIPGETFICHHYLFTIYWAKQKINQAIIHAYIATFENPFHRSITVTRLDPNAQNGRVLIKKTPLWLISKRSKMFLLLCTNRSMHGFNHIVECILHI